KPEQLHYEAGALFDAANPLKPEFLQKNHGYPGSSILIRKDGVLLVMLAHANADEPDNQKRAWRLGAIAFAGTRPERRYQYRWTPGKRMSISAELSSRGLMEPDLAELNDGRVLVVFRG